MSQITYYDFSSNGVYGNQISRGNCSPYGSLWKIKTKTDRYDNVKVISIDCAKANCVKEDLTERQKELIDEYRELHNQGQLIF